MNRILMLVLSFLFWFSLNTYIPYQTPFLTGMGYSMSVVGTVLGCYGITQMLLRIPVGLIADVKNRHKYIILAGSFLTGLNALLRILFPNAIGYLAANLVAGVACATWISFMVLFSSLFREEEMQRSTGLIIACSNGGGLLAFLAGTFFYTEYGMGLMCLLSVVSAAIGVVLCLFLKEERTAPRMPCQQKSMQSLLKVCFQKRILLFSLVALVQQGILNTTTLNLTAEHAKNLGADGFQLGLMAAFYMGEAVIFAFAAAGKLFIRIGARFWITAVLIFLGLYCLLLPHTTTMLQVHLLQVCCAMSQGILFTFATSEAMKGIPLEARGTAMGFHQAFFAIGITFVPVLAGNMIEKASLSAAYAVMAGMCMAALIPVQWFYHTAGHDQT